MNRLRWKLSLLWNKSYDDPYWLTLHPNQWRVYAEHYRMDLEEKVESQRQLAEYIMSFHNVEAVRAVQRTRDLQRRNEDKNVGDIFAKQVESLFGKNLSFDALEKARQDGVQKEVFTPDETDLQEQMEDVRKKAIPKEDTLVVRKPPQQPPKTDTQRFSQVPRTPKEDK